MNPRYRGDGKDLFKRGFLGLVRTLGLVRGPRVLPMFTGEFQEVDVDAYLSLLGVAGPDLVTKERLFPKKQRKNYFAAALSEAARSYDLFLDPDRGLISELHRETEDREVITYQEVCNLLPDDGSGRILMIYDEAVNMADRESATGEKMDALQASPYYLAAFTYFNSSPNHPNVVCVTNPAGKSRLSKLRSELNRCGIPLNRLVVCEA
ncbi:MAG TPA: hypothetical protein VKM72_32020 [Thermoanaerobaculia bacterium]|nr:hypothetical protein [Thermoanaerobaculia bacterium]